MRIRSNIIRVTYAGQDIFEPGQHLSATEYGFSRSFSTTAEPIIGAEAQTMRAYGNAQGSLNLPVSVDYASEPEAMAAALLRADHAEHNQTGVLTMSVDDKTRSWNAGIQSIECRLSYVANAVRLTVTYSFALGAEIG